VLEGVNFALKDSILLMQRLGVSSETLFALGGGARSELWRRILAATLGIKLQRLAAEEGPALGAALLAAVGWPACTLTSTPRSGPMATPERELEQRYSDLYRGFAVLYPALKQPSVW
jgi:xylulokinase